MKTAKEVWDELPEFIRLLAEDYATFQLGYESAMEEIIKNVDPRTERNSLPGAPKTVNR